MTDRISYDQCFMEIAETVSKRSTCDRKNVGAVITLNGYVVATGYNGAPRGMPHCNDPDVGHELVDMGGRMSCIRTAHAEANALVQAARHGAKVEGGTCYTTASPCYECMKLLINAGIITIICKEFYSSRYGMSDKMAEFSKAAGVDMIFLEEINHK